VTDSPQPVLATNSATSASPAAGSVPKLISVVLPVYNEAGSLMRLHHLLTEELAALAGGPDWELVFIDDGSRDESFERIRALSIQDPGHVRALRFARNFGKEAGMLAGLEAARGDVVVLMDSDLQHPPSLIPDMLQRWRDGARMVTAVRRSRETDSLPRKLVSQSFYLLFHWMTEVELPRGAGDFRLMDRQVVDAILAMPERSRFMKGITAWVGFRQELLPFDPAERHAGRSAWSFRSLFRYAWDGITAFSTVPLRVWSLLGVMLALISVLYGAWIVFEELFIGIDVPGYASLMVATLMLSGVQLISLGVLGEYIGRIFNEVKRRPFFILSERIEPPPESRDQGDGTGS